jgi:pimeloyl-ACP methyl ester carboxylesterase/DNA-binding CsgD family transcriptional regulator
MTDKPEPDPKPANPALTGGDDERERMNVLETLDTSPNADLIESIYRIALEPHTYDVFMDRWEEHVSESVARLDALREETEERAQQESSPQWATGSDEDVDFDGKATPRDPLNQTSLARHFETGYRLLEEMGRRNSSGSFFEADGASGGKPSLLFDATGQLVWFNGSAAKAFNPPNKRSMAWLNLEPAGRAVIDRLLEAASQLAAIPPTAAPRSAKEKSDRQEMLQETRPGVVRVLTAVNDEDEGEAKAITMSVRLIEDRNGKPLLLLRETGPDWHPSTDAMMAADFRLTAAELTTIRLLVEGLSVQEIAERRGLALETARKQLKTAMAKTGTRSQTELLRLSLTFIRIAEAAEPTAAHGANDLSGQQTDFRISGRKLPVSLHGPKGGRLVLFFHGMLDGCALPPNVAADLAARNMRLVCPVRPHFGEAEGDGGDIANAPQRFGKDAAKLLEKLGYEPGTPMVLMGHMAGAVYATAAAAHLSAVGHDVRGVVNVSGGVPIVSSSQISSMSRRQRLVAYTAKYTPALLPFVLRAGIRQLDYGGEDAFMDALYEASPIDLAATQDQDIRRVVSQGYHFTVAQGAKAFEIDAWHVVRDWSALVEASKVPFHLVHGRHDPVVSAVSVEAFADRLGERGNMTMLEDAAQLVLYPHPTPVLNAVEAFFAAR